MSNPEEKKHNQDGFGTCVPWCWCQQIRTCQNCGQRPATTRWIGHGCQLCAVRSGFDRLPQWCEQCCLQGQLDYLRPLVAKIPEIEARLKELA